jgi:hypothetical protein
VDTSSDVPGVSDQGESDDAVVGAPESVLTLFAVATAAAEAHELDGLETALASFRAASPSPVAAARRRWGRFAVVVGVASLVTVGAAAASGSLPDSAQRAVSGGLGRLGIDVPSPDDPPDTPADGGAAGDGAVPPSGSTPSGMTPPGLGTSNSSGSAASIEQRVGWCRGWMSSTPNGVALNTPSRDALVAAADAAGVDVARYCATLGVTAPAVDRTVPEDRGPNETRPDRPGIEQPPGKGASSDED